MSREKLRTSNRRAIYSSLLLWLAVHFVQALKPFGLPAFVPSSLLAAGLIAFPLFVFWPWVRDTLFKAAINKQEDPLPEDHLQVLVNLEIVALSAVLLLLLFYLPS